MDPMKMEAAMLPRTIMLAAVMLLGEPMPMD